MQRSLLVFGESLQTEATRKAYLYQLEQFRKWAKIKDYDSLLQGPPKTIQELLENYVIHLKNKVKPNSVPVYFAPIELFYVMNDVVINYKKLRKLFPKKTKKGNARGYTREEVKKILDNAIACGFGKSGIISTNEKYVIQLMCPEQISTPVFDQKILVSEDYLDYLIQEANRKLERSWKNIERLREFFQKM